VTQKQSGGDNSLNVQAGTIVIGASVAEMRQIALDVYRSNSLQLQEVARAAAEERVEALTDRFLLGLQQRYSEAPKALADPGVQFALFTAQREQARRGEPALEATLVDLLVERCGAPAGSLASLVLDEALATAGKLTAGQFAALTVSWYVKRTLSPGVATVAHHADWVRRFLLPFVAALPAHESSYQHLAYTGAATIAPARQPALGERMASVYPGIYTNGIPRMNLASEGTGLEAFENSGIFTPHERNEDYLRVRMQGQSLSLPDEVAELMTEKQREQLQRMALGNPMSAEQVMNELRPRLPEVDDLQRAFDDTLLVLIEPTSVGIAIGHANAQRVVGEQAPLSVWIED
jgi:hypothetical protein